MLPVLLSHPGLWLKWTTQRTILANEQFINTQKKFQSLDMSLSVLVPLVSVCVERQVGNWFSNAAGG